MRLALVSPWAATDARSWSGIPAGVLTALRAADVDVVDVSPLTVPNLRLRYVRHVVTRRLTGVGARYELDAATGRAFALEASRRCHAAGVDAVLSLGTLAVTDLDAAWPVACWCDATITDLTTVYEEYSRLSPRRRARAVAAEGTAMRRSEVVAFASPWAAGSARAEHGLAEGRVEVVPFGANLRGLATGATLDAALAARGRGTLELLWIGLDWRRKRGRFAVDVLTTLRGMGVDARLTLVGARPDDGQTLPPSVEHKGFVDKNDPVARGELERLTARSHFVLLPSRAECFGIAIAEGNAYGVPALGAAVGGLPGVLADGRNGELLAPEATPRDYADRLAAYHHAPQDYERLARSAHAEWAGRLNWGASTAVLIDRLERAVTARCT